MSSNHHDDAQQDAAFVRTFGLVLAAIVVIGVVIVYLARAVTADATGEGPGYAGEVAERVAPVGTLNTSGQPVAVTPAGAEPPAPAAAAPAATAVVLGGKEVYDSVCYACHTPGAAGAPKMGDAAAWAPRVAQGNDTLYKHAIEGYQGKGGYMPPKGGRVDLTDELVQAAVDHMIAKAQ